MMVKAYRPLIFEWFSAFAMFGIGLHMVIFPKSLSSGRFEHILSMISPLELVMLCVGIGAIRIGTLLCVWSWCFHARALCAVISACVWVEMGIALILSPGAPSIGIPVYLCLVAGELGSVWRARVESNNGRVY